MRGLFLLPLALPLVAAFNSYRSVLTDCLNQAQVPILLSSSTGWSQAIQAYNLRFMPAPNVVAMPRNVADVCLTPPPCKRQLFSNRYIGQRSRHMRIQVQYQGNREGWRPQLRRIRSCRNLGDRHGCVPDCDRGSGDPNCDCRCGCPAREHGDQDL